MCRLNASPGVYSLKKQEMQAEVMGPFPVVNSKQDSQVEMPSTEFMDVQTYAVLRVEDGSNDQNMIVTFDTLPTQ